ncbi:hypothetical protein [Budvicia aquatica]|uniref:hypothetical protein n=1 Tax=Budvicia aquatica TaxID=82979 RepID=UPI000410906E|nr:hypothetical protein [Budvicia aquatica]
MSLLEPLLQQQATAQVYRYQLSPGDDVKKDRPKKTLIRVLGGWGDARYWDGAAFR